MIYSLGLLSNIGDALHQLLRSLLGYIMALVYILIEYFYKVFEDLGRIQILNDEFVQGIYQRVGLILGMFMIFKLIFSLIKSLIDPDKLNDKKEGAASIIKRTVIAIILLGTTPYIFNEAYNIQNLIIGGTTSDNVLYKLITGKSSSNLESTGKVLSNDLYFEFFRDEYAPFLNEGTSDYMERCEGSEEGEYCDRFKEVNIETVREDARNGTTNLFDTVDYLALKENDSNEYVIEYGFYGFLGIVTGCFILWMIFMYCIQVAVRIARLAFLQLIAPIPILSYISDPEGSFKNWTDNCFATYLDLFFRLIIIYFSMTMVTEVFNIFKNLGDAVSESTGLLTSTVYAASKPLSPTNLIIEILIIIGLLLFASKAPDLIKDLFPGLSKGKSGLGFGLNFKKNVGEPLTNTMKGLYNSPLGWGLKAGVKGIQTIDRKKYNLPKPRNKFQQELDKLMPGRAEAIKNKVDGKKEVKDIDTKWNDGAKLANKLIKAGFGRFGTANGWDKALNGQNLDNYKKVFKHKEFITSKMNLDREKTTLEDLRDGLVQVQSGGTYAFNGVTYNASNISVLSKLYNSQSSKVTNMEKVHDSIRKQYSDDAKLEDQFKFVKNNPTNPANTTQTHGTKNI